PFQEWARLDLGQGLDLDPLGQPAGTARLADAYARLRLQRNGISLTGQLRMAPTTLDVTLLDLAASWTIGPWAISGQYQEFQLVKPTLPGQQAQTFGQSDILRRGVDALVGGSALPGESPGATVVNERFRQIQLAGRAPSPWRQLSFAGLVTIQPVQVGLTGN